MLFSIGSTMIFAHCVILMGVNSFKETTTGTFANGKSIYDVTGERSITKPPRVQSRERRKATLWCHHYFLCKKTSKLKKSSWPFLKGNFKGYNFHSLQFFIKVHISWYTDEKWFPPITAYVKVSPLVLLARFHVRGVYSRRLRL